jgi:hypothetical protein
MLTTYFLPLLLVTLAQSNQVEMLDLLAPVPPEVSNRATCPSNISGLARMTHASPPVMPLKLTLLDPGRTGYRIGDEVVFEVLVENVGPVPYTIPWAGEKDALKVRPDPCDPPPPGFRLFYLGLADKRPGWIPNGLLGLGMHGSELHPGSLKELKSGERVRVRSKATVLLGSTQQEQQWIDRVRFPATLNVVARLSPVSGFTPATIPDPVFSGNTISISISK